MTLLGIGPASGDPEVREVVVPTQRTGEEHRDPPWVTILVPTRNEAGNVGPLIEALEASLAGQPAEILFVDDSTDDTPAVVRGAAKQSRLPVRLLHRPEADRLGGLGGAVLAGLASVASPWVVVMDGDLQHPPEMAHALLAKGMADGADLVIGSRYLTEGTNAGLGGMRRVAVSRVAGLLSRFLFPHRLRGVTDPMSGLFAVRVEALALASLKPHGFKILLEILARTAGLRVAEVPFTFGQRLSGNSKASFIEGLRFARHVTRLRLSVLRHGRPARVLAFAAVGVSGIGINAAAFWTAQLAGLHYLIAAVLATQASTLWNFVGTDALVFSGGKRLGLAWRLMSFAAVNEALLLARLPLIALLVASQVPALFANAGTLLAAFFLRFAISERLFLNERPS